MRLVEVGSYGLEVGAIGFGAWGLSGDYGPAADAESIETIRAAVELGANLVDTADEYGQGNNERLVGRAIRGRRDSVVLATKVGLVRGPEGVQTCGRPEHIRSATHASLERLAVAHVDVLYLHRVDPTVPIEETVGAMAELVREGKVRHLGLCEVSGDIVRRAHAVHPLSVVQSEYSLWTRDPECEILPLLSELGIGFVAFSPLGRGFLAGAVTTIDDLSDQDFRRALPRFAAHNLTRNAKLREALCHLAAGKGATPAQIALAWILKKGAVPIPGTRRRSHVESNVAALDVRLEPPEVAQLETLFPPGVAAGERYPETMAVFAGRTGH